MTNSSSELLLRVTNKIFVAGAVFHKSKTDPSGWKCVRTAPILGWWLKCPTSNIKAFLKGPGRKKGWRYEWIRKNSGA